MDQETVVRPEKPPVWRGEAELVFVTKVHGVVFTEAVRTDCERIVRDVCDDFHVKLVTFTSGDDHVALRVSYPPTVQVSKLVNSLKGVSSRHLRRLHPELLEPFLWEGRLWSRSYFCGTVGPGDLDREIAAYLDSQHRSGSRLSALDDSMTAPARKVGP